MHMKFSKKKFIKKPVIGFEQKGQKFKTQKLKSANESLKAINCTQNLLLLNASNGAFRNKE